MADSSYHLHYARPLLWVVLELFEKAMIKLKPTFASLCLAGLICGQNTFGAGQPLVTSWNSGTPAAASGGTLGFSFTVGNTPISVSQLGILTNTFNGAGNVVVDLWDTSGNVLASSSLSGAGASTVGAFEYNTIVPVTLNANTTYVIAETLPLFANDYYIVRVSSTVMGAGITFGQAEWSSSGFPTTDAAANGQYIGPNAVYNLVPEPAALSLCGLAAISFGLFGRRRVSVLRCGDT